MNRLPRARERGAALTEMALMLPVLVLLVMFSLFLTELVHGRFKMQEASRYLAWEMTSYSLSDYSPEDRADKTNPQLAYNTARSAALAEAKERYKDLDSVEDNQPFTALFATYDPPQMTFNDGADINTPPITDGDMHLGSPRGDATNPQPYDAMQKGEKAVLTDFGFNLQGRVQANVTTSMHNKIIPKHYLELGQGGFSTVDPAGGRNIDNLGLKSVFTLVADDWHLSDGADAVMAQGRAGRHMTRDNPGGNSGLWRQVNRMTFYDNNDLGGFQWHKGLLAAVFSPRLTPNPSGTFVVSHAYLPNGATGAATRDCQQSDLHPAKSGLNDLQYKLSGGTGSAKSEDGYPGIDGEYTKAGEAELRCFDTSPFQDTHAYGDTHAEQGSLYIDLFRHRGLYYNGCKNAQADDPTHVSDTSATDKYTAKVNCE